MSTAPPILHIRVHELGNLAHCGLTVPSCEPLMCLEIGEANTCPTQPTCPACLKAARVARGREWLAMRDALRSIAEMAPGSRGAYQKFQHAQNVASRAVRELRT